MPELVNTRFFGIGSTKLILSAILIISIIAIGCAYFPQRPLVQARGNRHFSLRVDQVPSHASLNDLKEALNTIIGRDPYLRENIHDLSCDTLVRRDKNNACATVSFNTSTAKDLSELVRRLQKAKGQQPYTFDSHFHHITPLYEHETDVKADVISVTGLAGHALGSWRSPNSNDVWLRNYLPQDVPNIRVLLYGYETKLLNSESRQSIEEMGQFFLESLVAFRRNDNTNHRPIVFIGHSLGGIVIKEALIYAAKKSNEKQYQDMCNACCGLLFFGVPHLGLRHEQLMNLVEGQANQRLIRDIVVDDETAPSTYLNRISQEFPRYFGDRYPITSFYETKLTRTLYRQSDGTFSRAGPMLHMVTEKSATSVGATPTTDEDNLALDTDHSGLVKYDSRFQGAYPIVKGRIIDLVSKGVSKAGNMFADDLDIAQRQQWINLNEPPYSSFRNSSNLSKPEHGTLEWLVDDERLNNDYPTGLGPNRLQSHHFMSWRDSEDSEFLLVTAPPGSGKSVFSNFVVGHLQNCMKSNEKVIYYFCNFRNDAASRNASSILRALIVQLCEARKCLFNILPSDLSGDSTRFISSSFDTLLNILENMLRDGTYDRVYCVIDGLDVYFDDTSDMDELIMGLKRIFTDGNEDKDVILKLLCTSRPNRSIQRNLDEVQCRTLHCSSRDVATFTNSRIASLSFDDDMKDMIRKRLDSKKESTFLWIDVVIRKLNALDFPSINDVEDVIENSKEELFDLYADLVSAALQKDEKLARILAWIVYAKRPLGYVELAEAIAIGPEDRYESYIDFVKGKPSITPDRIYRNLGTLLDVTGGKAYVIHQSVMDFFEKKHPLQGAFGCFSPRLFPAYVCMSYLNLRDNKPPPRRGNTYFDEGVLLSERGAFLPYASNYWHSHVKSAEEIEGEVLEELVRRTTDISSRPTVLWLKWCYVRIPERCTNPVTRIAIEFDIGWLAELVLDRRIGDLHDDFEKDCVKKEVDIGMGVLRSLLKHKRRSEFDIPDRYISNMSARWGRPYLLEIKSELIRKHLGSI